SHERGRIRKFHLLCISDMVVKCIALKSSGNNTKESNPIPVFWVKVCVNFKNKSTKLIIFRFYKSFIRIPSSGSLRYFNKRIQQFLHSEIIYRRTKKYGRNIPCLILLSVKRLINPIN